MVAIIFFPSEAPFTEGLLYCLSHSLQVLELLPQLSHDHHHDSCVIEIRSGHHIVGGVVLTEN